ncbi:MAG: tetratricopeptide repeat protein, partial [Planctomycetota bacterium]
EDVRLETVYRHFERNLKDISRIASKSGAKIIFCTVVSNLKDCPPFASLHKPPLTEMNKKKWDKIYQQGVTYETANNYGEAAVRYLAAAGIDDYYADLQFRLGRCYWAMGEYGKARDRYIRARELDTLRLRADNRINETIRAVAGDKSEEGVYLTDAVKIFEKNSPHEVTGEELFYEHVHLNFRGNYLLAKTIFEQVDKLLPEWVRIQKAGKRSFITEEECARRLVYSDWSRYRIADNVLNSYIKLAPFTNQLYHKEHVKEMEKQLQALEANMTSEVLRKVVSKYSRAIENDLEDWWLRWRYVELLLVGLKDYQSAAKQCRWVVDNLPFFHVGHAKLAMLLCELGRTDEGIDYYLKALQINPICADTHRYLGWAYQQKGKVDKAIEHYSQSLRIIPTNAKVHFSLGLIYQGQDRFDKAVEQYREALRLRQDYAEAYNNLAITMYQQGKINEAIQTYRRGLAFVPDNLDLHYNLGIVLGQQGRIDDAIKELRAALKIDPNSAKTHKVLKAMLERDR